MPRTVGRVLCVYRLRLPRGWVHGTGAARPCPMRRAAWRCRGLSAPKVRRLPQFGKPREGGGRHSGRRRCDPRTGHVRLVRSRLKFFAEAFFKKAGGLFVALRTAAGDQTQDFKHLTAALFWQQPVQFNQFLLRCGDKRP